MAYHELYLGSGAFLGNFLYGRYIVFVPLLTGPLEWFAHLVCRTPKGWLALELGQVSICIGMFCLPWGDSLASGHATFHFCPPIVSVGVNPHNATGLAIVGRFSQPFPEVFVARSSHLEPSSIRPGKSYSGLVGAFSDFPPRELYLLFSPHHLSCLYSHYWCEQGGLGGFALAGIVDSLVHLQTLVIWGLDGMLD